jgi:outer membrane protein TolC
MAALAMAGLAGCGTLPRSDASVHRVLKAEAARSLPHASHTVADAVAAIEPAGATAPELDLDLAAALRMAMRHSRSLQTKREKLFLSGLSTLGVDRQFEPQCSGTLGYVLAWPEGGDESASSTAGLKVRQALPLGGAVEVSGGLAGAKAGETNDASYTTTAGIEVRQPLLAGAGYEASHGELIQSRRDLVYALRGFALERQDFALGILRSYYNLLLRKNVEENTRQNVEQSSFLRRRSEALFRIRRAPSIDVLRAQQQELSASNTLVQTRSAYEIDVSRFLIDLGLPVNTRVTLGGEMPAKETLTLTCESCLRLALANRLDLRTQEDQLEDARRRLRLARNAHLPKVEAYGRADKKGDPVASAEWPEGDPDYSAGVTVEVPLDRRDRQDAVKTASIAVSAAERSVDEKRDSVRVEITDSFSKLETLAATVEIEARNIELAQRRAEYAAFRFRNGELSNRDVVEAQNELLNARNAYAGALVQYESQRLQLLRDVGLLDVGPDGAIVEMPGK